jgi:hypothetical protein
VFLGGKGGFLAGWRAFFVWDGYWFYTVASSGYFMPETLSRATPGNVHFFPAYPLLCRAVHWVTGVDWPLAMVLTASAAYLGFWIYFLLIVQRWRVPPGMITLAAALVVLHPTAFFFVAPYSESLFLCASFGFIYWQERDGAFARVMAGLHGFVVTATRIVGMPLVVYPFIRDWSRHGNWRDSLGTHVRRLMRQLPVIAATAAGAGAFLIYLHVQFGDWAAFIKNAEAGWGIHSKYSALISPYTYNLRLKSWAEFPLDPMVLSRLSADLCLLAFVVLAFLERAIWRLGDHSSLPMRLPLYFAAFVLFAIPVTSHGEHGLICFSRFSLLPAALLVMVGAHLAATAPAALRLRWLRWPIALVLIGFTIANVLMTMRFASNRFVA